MTEMELCWAYNEYSCNVTITGADDKVDVGWLVDTSRKYPFVEWGILIGSGDRYGTPRYPSQEWILEASRVLGRSGSHFAVHLCGVVSKGYQDESESHQLAIRNLLFMALVPQQVRIQLNGTRKNKFKTPMPFVEHILVESTAKKACALTKYEGLFDNVVLIDVSGGRGAEVDLHEILLDTIFYQKGFQAGCRIGIAGGIHERTIADAVDTAYAISKCASAKRPWVDLETGARTNNEFDKDKVIAILEAAKGVLLG